MPTFSVVNTKSGKNSNPEDNFINGFELHMFERDKPNLYKHKSLVFKHPHRETCQSWFNKIADQIPSNSTDYSNFTLFGLFISLTKKLFKMKEKL